MDQKIFGMVMSNRMLEKAIKAEKNAKMNRRLIAVNMIESAGCTTMQASMAVNTTQRSVQLWLEAYRRAGVDGLRDLPKTGRPSLVSIIMINYIANHLSRINKLTPRHLQEKLKQRTGVKYSLCNIRKLLRSLDLVPKVATQTYVNADSRATKIYWQESTDELISIHDEMGYTIVVQDESIFKFDSLPNKKYWGRRGEKIIINSTGSHEKIVVYGALAGDGTKLYRIYLYFDAETVVKYLEQLRLKWGKVFVIMDNASQHKGEVVQKYLKKHGKDVVLHFLPVGAPELSAVEASWRQSKYEKLYSESYETFTEMWASISDWLRTKRFKLDIYKFLWRNL